MAKHAFFVRVPLVAAIVCCAAATRAQSADASPPARTQVVSINPFTSIAALDGVTLTIPSLRLIDVGIAF